MSLVFFYRSRWISFVWAFVAVLLWLVAADRSSAQSSSALSQEAVAGEWSQFLGPQRNGLSSETGLLEMWPDGGPKQVWRVSGGVGMSGLAISRGRVLTMLQREGQQWLVALNAATGESIWNAPIANAYRNSMGDGPRATPTVSGDRVFIFSGEGRLAAIDFPTGNF